MIFSTWDEVKTYLRHIAHDPVIDRLNRWYFFDWMGEHCKSRRREAGSQRPQREEMRTGHASTAHSGEPGREAGEVSVVAGRGWR